MEVKRKYTFMAMIALMVLTMAMGVQGVISSAPSAGSNPNDGVLRLPPSDNRGITLNTVDYVLRIINDKVLVPDVTLMGPAYRIIGVDLKVKPQFDTTINHITYRDWLIVFVISDRPFVNGTTMNSDLGGHWISVAEKPSTGYGTSYDNAVEFLAPDQLCGTPPGATQQTCTQVPGNSGQLIQIRNTWLAVRPDAPSAFFEVDGANRIVQIGGDGVSGDLSYQQVLEVAGSMIP